jgi:glyoxylase-like metal-dependent hydrolase (beta-lactamase superfamily II)
MAAVVTVMVGEARVSLIQEGSLPVPANELFQGFSPADWAGRLPEGDEGEVVVPVHVALIQIDGEVILVDTGLGQNNPEGGEGGQLVPALAELGLKPEDVTRVVITHTHGDHVGGTLDRSGDAIRPAFPRARHHLPRADWEWVEGFPAELRDRYLSPLKALPDLTLDGPDVRLTPSVRLLGSAGHTPGHRCVVVESGGQTFCFLGDLVHHPTLHFAAPDKLTTWDARPELTPSSRRRVAAEATAGDWLLAATHGASPPLGRLTADGADRWTWRPSARSLA